MILCDGLVAANTAIILQLVITSFFSLPFDCLALLLLSFNYTRCKALVSP